MKEEKQLRHESLSSKKKPSGGFLEIDMFDEASLSSLSDSEDAKNNIVASNFRKNRKITRTENVENHPAVSFMQQRILALQSKNKLLTSDKALLELDLLETQHESYSEIKRLKLEIFALREAKARDDIELLNIIISLEKKIKEDQKHFLELFSKKDKEISMLRKKMIKKKASRKKKIDNDKIPSPPSTAPSSPDTLHSNNSTVLEQYDESTQSIATSKNDSLKTKKRVIHKRNTLNEPEQIGFKYVSEKKVVPLDKKSANTKSMKKQTNDDHNLHVDVTLKGK